MTHTGLDTIVLVVGAALTIMKEPSFFRVSICQTSINDGELFLLISREKLGNPILRFTLIQANGRRDRAVMAFKPPKI